MVMAEAKAVATEVARATGAVEAVASERVAVDWVEEAMGSVEVVKVVVARAVAAAATVEVGWENNDTGRPA